MTDYASGKFGGFQFPLDATVSDNAALLKASDPAIFYALDFYSNMIATLLGDRIVGELASVGIVVTSGVMYAVPTDPVPLLTQEQFRFPMLAMHRVSSVNVDKTVHRRRKIADVQVHFVLPTMSAGQAERLTTLLNAVESTLVYMTDQGAHPSYTPPTGSAVAGDSMWQASGIDYADMPSGKIGAFTDGQGNLYMPAWTGILKIAERSNLLASDFEAMASASDTVKVSDGNSVNDLTVADVLTNTT